MLAKYKGPSQTVETFYDESGPIPLGKPYNSNAVTTVAQEIADGGTYDVEIAAMEGPVVQINGTTVVPPQTPVTIFLEGKVLMYYMWECFTKQWEMIN